jgi:hypothetical protein
MEALRRLEEAILMKLRPNVLTSRWIYECSGGCQFPVPSQGGLHGIDWQVSDCVQMVLS